MPLPGSVPSASLQDSGTSRNGDDAVKCKDGVWADLENASCISAVPYNIQRDTRSPRRSTTKHRSAEKRSSSAPVAYEYTGVEGCDGGSCEGKHNDTWKLVAAQQLGGFQSKNTPPLTLIV